MKGILQYSPFYYLLLMVVIFVDYSVCLHHHLQDGKTPLELAKQSGHQSVVDYLVNLGEHIHTCNHNNEALFIIVLINDYNSAM